MKAPSCPDHPAERLLRMKRGWYCEECGHNVLPLEAATSSKPSTLRAGLESWPRLLATPVAEFLDETHPLQRLHRLCDVTEVLTRFLVVLTLAVLRSRSASLPPRLGVLLAHLERPTLGVWAGLLERAQESLDDDTETLLALRELALAKLLPLLLGERCGTERGAEGEGPGAIDSILELRNVLVHGGTLSERAARQLLEAWEPPLVELLKAAPFERCDLLYVGDRATFRLRGTSGLPRVEPPEHAGSLGHVLLRADGRSYDMWPLCSLPPEGSREAPALYYRTDQRLLLYSVVGGRNPLWRSRRGYEDFRALFSGSGPAGRTPSQDFWSELRADASAFVGRRAALASVKQVVKRTRQGVIWLQGPAGGGKSFLLAKLAVDLVGDPRRRLCLAWRFRRGDRRCSRAAFLDYANQHLSLWLGRPRPKRQEREDEFEGHLAAFARRAADAGTHLRVVVVLDGLDEVHPLDRGVAELPFLGQFAGITWVCSGRGEGGLSQIFAPPKSVHVFPERGLPPMDSVDVRAMLLDQPGELKYRVLARDKPPGQGDSTGLVAENDFISEVVERAAGLPLYVRLLIEDLLAGAVDSLDPESLPSGLKDYYGGLLQRLSVGDVQSLVTPTLVALALASEPLGEAELGDLLALMRRVISAEAAAPLVESVLDHAQGLVQAAPAAEGSGWTLAHDTLRTHILSEPVLVNERVLVERAFCEAVLGEGPPEGALAGYLARHGPGHLLTAGRYGEFLACSEQAAWQEGSLHALRLRLKGEGTQELEELLRAGLEREDSQIVTLLLSALEDVIALGRIVGAEKLFPALSDLVEAQGDAPTIGRLRVLQARSARLHGDLTRALRWFDQAGDDLSPSDAFEKANAVRESGNYPAAIRAYEDLYADCCARPGPLAERLLFGKQLADAHYVQGRHRVALALLEALGADLPAPPPREWAEALRIQGHVERMNERLEEAEACYLQARAIFESYDDAFGLARTETNLAESLVLLRPREGLALSACARQSNERLGVRIEVGKAINAEGQALLALGELDRAEALFARALDLQEEIGYRSGVGMVLINLLHLDLLRFDLEKAWQTYRSLESLFRQLKAYPYLVYRGALLLERAGASPANCESLRRRQSLSSEIEWLEDEPSFRGRVYAHYRAAEEEGP